MLGWLLDFVYPPRCLFCGELLRSAKEMCATCQKSIFWIDSPACPFCGKREQECECYLKLPIWNGCVAVAYYGDTIKKGVASFKFYRRKSNGMAMGRLMAQKIKENFQEAAFDCIIPVPMSKSRFQKRGYNQAELLAHEISKRIEVKMQSKILQRGQDRLQQSRLSRQERLKNLKGAFQISRPQEIKGKTILLVDDVTTTGATLEECTRILKREGAQRVYCAVFALSLPRKYHQTQKEAQLYKI